MSHCASRHQTGSETNHLPHPMAGRRETRHASSACLRRPAWAPGVGLRPGSRGAAHSGHTTLLRSLAEKEQELANSWGTMQKRTCLHQAHPPEPLIHCKSRRSDTSSERQTDRRRPTGRSEVRLQRRHLCFNSESLTWQVAENPAPFPNAPNHQPTCPSLPPNCHPPTGACRDATRACLTSRSRGSLGTPGQRSSPGTEQHHMSWDNELV